ncbi:hypothetical protein PQO03_14235 [Lentisphaera profundi]|uniref:Lipoprotein n=1 Tax=Lentisphaera profundi TaxID=1658616 RepID=A0ABY7W0J4_9BACT|nr:hypothetical protein [Lentisphaera profundi]WDE98993.1 hypothetical protein PQO03_14235 [Lentisphaera profundi]
MKKYILLLSLSVLCLLLLTPSCVGTSEVVKMGDDQFPQVGGMNLHGDEKQFPDCLSAEKTIAIVAFKREQQAWVDEYYAEIGPLLEQNPNLAYYEIPTISKLSSPIRWWIYRGMRGGIKDDTMRASVITLHIDKDPFKKHLGIINEEIIYVYLLDSNGNILDSIDGRYSSEKWQKFIGDSNL